MQESLANDLGLKWDFSLILNAENYTLWSGGDIGTNFPGDSDLRMIVFLCTFPVGYSSVFLEITLDNLLAALASTAPTTSISYGIPQAGDSTSLLALAKNNFNSFLDKIT